MSCIAVKSRAGVDCCFYSRGAYSGYDVMTYDWMTSSCAGRSFGLHGAGKRGAAVVPVYGVRALCMMLALPLAAGRSGRGGSCQSLWWWSCGCGWWVGCVREKGKNRDLLTASGWFLAAFGGPLFPFGIAWWWYSAFLESLF